MGNGAEDDLNLITHLKHGEWRMILITHLKHFSATLARLGLWNVSISERVWC